MVKNDPNRVGEAMVPSLHRFATDSDVDSLRYSG